MKNKEKLFNCHYVGGDDTIHDGGIWNLTETPKTFRFLVILPPYFGVNWEELIIYKTKVKKNRHAFHDWEDGTYTIYPDQCGIPHYLEAKHATQS